MWYRIHNQHVTLTILAKPNAKKTALMSVGDEALHISLHAKPHQGEANQALITFLSKLLRVPKTQIVLQRGEGSRHKQVMLPLTDAVRQLIEEPGRFVGVEC